jgi:tetraprenyl-beta-curcumene synthase
MESTYISTARNVIALLKTGIIYWLGIVPSARREIHAWQRYARSIPNPTFRELALGKLSQERLNPEAAACFSILAPRRSRGRCIQLIVAYQIMYDYLDAVNELPDYNPLADGLQLHSALTQAAGQCESAENGYYRHHDSYEDGGYLSKAVRACRTIVQGLPSSHLAGLIIDAADRCGEGQSRNHAIPIEGQRQLIAWSNAQAADQEYLWWELAAGGISCLAIHALFAAAADPATTLAEATCVDAAYFPPVCSISALLDSLIDHEHDADIANHSFVAHYESSAYAASRFAAIADEADRRISGLRSHCRHRIILAGLVAFYLSAPEAAGRFAGPVTRQTIDAIGPITTPMLAVMRLRRRTHAALGHPAKPQQDRGGTFSSE